MLKRGKDKKFFNSDVKKLLLLLLLPVAYHFLFFFLKYQNQDLQFSKLNIFYIGNLFNVILFLVLILGLTILFIKSRKELVNNFNKYLICELIGASIILLLFFESKIEIKYPTYYILRHPFERIFISCIYYLYLLSQLIMISYLWLSIIGVSNLHFIRSVFNSVLILFILLFVAFIYSPNNKNVSQNKVERKKNNIGIVLGAAVVSNNKPGSILMMRLNSAYELYKNNIIKKLQLTGGNAPGEISEAEAAFNYLKNFEINPYDIYIETKTSSTNEQINFIFKNDFNKKYDEVIIVSDKHHLKRINQICKFYGLKVSLFGVEISLTMKNLIYYKLRETFALLTFWLFAI